jgi:hypothetical protein
VIHSKILRNGAGSLGRFYNREIVQEALADFITMCNLIKKDKGQMFQKKLQKFLKICL